MNSFRFWLGLHQGPGERVLEFSHRCKASFLDLINRQKAVGKPVLQETTLINHFSRNVRDRQMAKYLKEKMGANPTWTFSEIREAALEWSEDDQVEASAHAVNSTTSEPLLHKFWDLESIGISDCNKQVVDPVLVEFNNTVVFSNGRNEVSLPWKIGKKPHLHSNMLSAKKRLDNLTRKLN